MKLLMKQIKCELKSNLWESVKLTLIVPVMSVFFIFGKSSVWNAQSFMLMMALLAIPAGVLTLSLTRMTTSIHTALSMGSTRRVFYVSNALSSAVMFLVLTVLPLVVTGIILLPFDAVQAKTILMTAVSPGLIGGAFCIDTLAFGAGTLIGGLVNRYGRKVFIIMFILLALAGGVVGGVIGAGILQNRMTISVGNNLMLILSLGIFGLGILLYGIGWRTVKKYYVS